MCSSLESAQSTRLYMHPLQHHTRLLQQPTPVPIVQQLTAVHDNADLSSLGCPLLVVQQQLQEDGSYSVSRSVAFSIAWLPKDPADSTFHADLAKLRHCRAPSTQQLVGGNVVQELCTQAAVQSTPGAKRSNQHRVTHRCIPVKTATHC